MNIRSTWKAAALLSPAIVFAQSTYRSTITIYDLATGTTHTVYKADQVIEAPNWSRDGKSLLVNTGGSLYRLPLNEPKLEKIDVGDYRCNNDHDLSRDGKLLAFSASTPSSRQSQVYLANADGTGVKLMTKASPSYFHGWSPDAKWLAVVGQRDNKFELFRVPASGGPEERLTSKGGYDDGPEYSPDGKWIYFNSNRSGGWDIWRMPPEGAGPGDAKAERITSDEWEDWFPHISPDGKSMVFLSFPKGTANHNGKMDGVVLRIMPTKGNSAPKTLTTFFGGQGTINVNSWSPDSKRFAYVVYEPLPIFESHQDIGTVLHPGSFEFDPQKQTYTISGSGENVWATTDAYHFAWKKVSGDIKLAADISFIGAGGNAHRKAMLMIRQSLDPGSAYADVALHGVGLTSLQVRDENGGATHEIQSNVDGPKRVQIEKRGQYFYISVDGRPAGGSMRVALTEPFYVGLGVCAHDKDAVEKAVFSNIDLSVPTGKPVPLNTLETITVTSTDRRVTYTTPEQIESPNWTPDGTSLLFNSGGRIQKIAVTGGTPQTIDTGSATHCTGNHGLSPDGKTLAITDNNHIYLVPASGGEPKLLTPKPATWHGWSPDGLTILFTAATGIYTIPVAGGPETSLATGDNPEFSPDGQFVYFDNGQIWRMNRDGSSPEQLTSDGMSNRFPHISPDGRQLAFLSSSQGETALKVLNLTDKRLRILAKLTGGAGIMDAPSWSPNSKQLAFVSK
jgi:TolB protein